VNSLSVATEMLQSSINWATLSRHRANSEATDTETHGVLVNGSSEPGQIAQFQIVITTNSTRAASGIIT